MNLYTLRRIEKNKKKTRRVLQGFMKNRLSKISPTHNSTHTQTQFPISAWWMKYKEIQCTVSLFVTSINAVKQLFTHDLWIDIKVRFCTGGFWLKLQLHHPHSRDCPLPFTRRCVASVSVRSSQSSFTVKSLARSWELLIVLLSLSDSWPAYDCQRSAAAASCAHLSPIHPTAGGRI